MGVVRTSGRGHGWAERDLGQGSRVDLRLFIPQFSTDSHLLGEDTVNRNPQMIIVHRFYGNAKHIRNAHHFNMVPHQTWCNMHLFHLYTESGILHKH